MRKLTNEELDKFAAREGVRKIAVENFLMTVTNNSSARIAELNLREDAVRYKWNPATCQAIKDGIALSVEVSK